VKKLKKKPYALIIMFAFVLTSTPLLVGVTYANPEYTQPQAELYVGRTANKDVYDPVNITCEYVPCQTLTVYIKVRNITDLWGVSFYMDYNPTVLNCTAVRYGTDWGVKDTDYLGFLGTINRTKGSIEAYDGARMTAALPTNATLYEVDFHMLNWGESWLNMSGTPTELRDSLIQPIYCPITDGWFSCPPAIAPYTLTISTTIGGTTNPPPGTHTYTPGTVVEVLAIPSADYIFDYWMLDGVSNTSNPINIKMDTNRTLQAFFTYVPPVFITPINKTINVTSGETFMLVYKFNFSQPERGYFATTISWDNNETDPNAPYWNFTYESFVAQFTDDTSFWGPVTAAIWKAVPPGYPPGYYRYSVTISESYGEIKNGEFWVNVTMRAAGQSGGIYVNHTAPADHNITISSTFVAEAALVTIPDGVCTIHVEKPLIHDVAIIGISLFRTVVGEGIRTAFTEIYVVAENQGNVTETFDVIVYRDSRIVLIQYDVTLPAGANTTLIFVWSTFGVSKGRYIIKAVATSVPGEVDLADNTFVDGTFTVTIPGDANGDGTAQLVDLMLLAWSYGKAIGEPGYNPNTDFDCNGLVSLTDLMILSWNYGKSDP